MKSIFKVLAVLILLVTIFSPQTAVSAGGGGGTYNFKAMGVNAFFSTTDPSGCIITDVNLFAANEVLKGPKVPPSGGPRAVVIISQYDVCDGGSVLLAASGSVPLAGSELQLSNKLDSASLNTTINVYDEVSQTNFDVYVDVTWTGTGPLTRDKVNQHFNSPGCKVHLRSNGAFRLAEASGSISDGVTEFAPSPSSWADMFSVKNGSVTIGCGT